MAQANNKIETTEASKPITEEVAPAAIVDQVAEPVVKQKAAKVAIEVKLAKNLDFIGVRVIGTYLMYNDGMKARRVVIEKGKPIIVTIRQ